MPDMLRTARRRFAVHSFRRVFALLALVAPVWVVPTKAAAKAGPVWVRLELVENTAEGPAFDRCVTEGILKARDAHRWRLFCGEAHAGPAAG